MKNIFYCDWVKKIQLSVNCPRKNSVFSRKQTVKRTPKISLIYLLFESCRFQILSLHLSMRFNCWFSHDVTKIQSTKLSTLLRFYFHGVLEQVKTNFQTNFCFKRVLGFVIEYA